MKWALGSIVSTLFLVSASPSLANLPPRTERIVVRYIAELQRVEASPVRTSMEDLFALTDTLRDYLVLGYSRSEVGSSMESSPMTIEDLSDQDYEALSRRLRGMLLNRLEVIVAERDSTLFLPLARSKGVDPDRAFMEIYFKTIPEVWPAYIDQQTDYSGCYVYGTGAMVSLYEGWRQFRTKYPSNYVQWAEEQLDDIRGLFTDVRCACEGQDTVVLELQRFLNRFPRDEIAGKVRDQLKSIQEGRTKIRFHCISG